MCDKINLNEIKKIPQEEFKEILHTWMDQKEVAQSLQKKLRKELVTDFQKTSIAKRLNAENQKNMFNSKEYVIDTLQAEHLYKQNNHFTLSVFFTETRHSTMLPNFEQEKSFRFERKDVQDLVEMLGLPRTDQITRRVLNTYKSSNESLLSVLLKELIHCHKLTETKAVETQTETKQQQNQQQSLDVSIISSKSKRSKRKKIHSIVNKDYKPKKPKKLKEVTVITQNLEKMSNNISLITNKLDEFKQNPNQDESKTIIGYVATIMVQLNGCIANFETLCGEIKQINHTRHKSYDEWIDDLKNGNGQRFLKKLQKSFSRVMEEEKSKLQKDFSNKLQREKRKLSKFYRSTANKDIDAKAKLMNYPVTITKEIAEIFEETCKMMKKVDKEDEMFELSLELEIQQAKALELKKALTQSKISTILEPLKKLKESQLKPNSSKGLSDAKSKLESSVAKLNLNDCRQIHAAESSSETPSYGTKSFENDESDDNN